MTRSHAENTLLDALLGAFTKEWSAFPSSTICHFLRHLRPAADFRVFSRISAPLLRRFCAHPPRFFVGIPAAINLPVGEGLPPEKFIVAGGGITGYSLRKSSFVAPPA